ncbi:MAG: hypothetical protein ABSF32_11165 [Ignavibacteria bacterium]|jgi:hypothetical protein
MKIKLSNLKNIINRLSVVAVIILKVLSILMVFVGLFNLILFICINLFEVESNTFNYQLVLATLAVIGAVSALSFSAASSSEDKNYKKYYYNSGIKLLFSILLISFALLLRFLITDIYHINITSEEFLNEQISKQIFIIAFSIVAFMYLLSGLIVLLQGLQILFLSLFEHSTEISKSK